MAKKQDPDVDRQLQDALFDDFDKFENIVVGQWRNILFLCAFVVAIVMAVAIITQVRASSKVKEESTIADATTVEALESVIARYSGKPATRVARVKLAMLYRESGEFDRAIALLRDVTTGGEASDLTWRAALNIGYILELSDKKAEAADHFDALGLDSAMPGIVRNEANYSAGRLRHALGDTEKAKSILDRVNENRPGMDADSLWAELAEKLLNRLQSSAKSTSADS
jgi:tetratricopeptide (TPR) repeat protein